MPPRPRSRSRSARACRRPAGKHAYLPAERSFRTFTFRRYSGTDIAPRAWTATASPDALVPPTERYRDRPHVQAPQDRKTPGHRLRRPRPAHCRDRRLLRAADGRGPGRRGRNHEQGGACHPRSGTHGHDAGRVPRQRTRPRRRLSGPGESRRIHRRAGRRSQGLRRSLESVRRHHHRPATESAIPADAGQVRALFREQPPPDRVRQGRRWTTPLRPSRPAMPTTSVPSACWWRWR